MVPYAPLAVDYERVIHTCRLALEEAGNPAFLVAAVDAVGITEISPVIYSTLRSASDHGRRVTEHEGRGDIVVVARQAEGERAEYTIFDPESLKKLHRQLEVIERSVADEAPDL